MAASASIAVSGSAGVTANAVITRYVTVSSFGDVDFHHEAAQAASFPAPVKAEAVKATAAHCG